MSSKQLAKKISQGSLFLSIAFLFDKTIPLFNLKLDVIFLLLSLVFLVVAVYRKEIQIAWQELVPYAVIVGIILFSTIAGSLLSLHIFGSIPFRQILTEYKILLGCFLVFFEIIILGRGDDQFLMQLTYAFLISLMVIVMPYIRIDFIQYIIGAKQYRFFGLIGDANYYPTFMMLPIMLIFYFLMKEYYAKRRALLLIFLYFLFALTVGLTWWSGSRSGWLGVITEIMLFIIVFARQHIKKTTFIIVWTIVFIAAVATSYGILPHNARSDIRARLGYITTPEQQVVVNDSSDTLQPLISNGDNSVKTISIIDAVSYSQDRIHIWKQSIHYFIENPMGYGLVYYNIVNIVSGTTHVTAHSLIFESLLIGGWLLCIVLLCLVIDVAYAFFTYKEKTDIEIVLFAALVGLLVCGLFLSGLLLRWFWIYLALLIAWQLNRGYTSCFSFRKKGIADSRNQHLEK